MHRGEGGRGAGTGTQVQARTAGIEGRHLTVTPHFSCVAPYETDTSSCLLETKDAGATWTILTGSPKGDEGATQVMLDSKTWLYGSPFTGIWRTADGGGSWDEVYAGFNNRGVVRSASGIVYMSGWTSGILQSPDLGATWSVIPGSPAALSLVGDGSTLFAGFSSNHDVGYFSSAPASDPTQWTSLPGQSAGANPWMLGYDAGHHVLYAPRASPEGGAKGALFRLVTN